MVRKSIITAIIAVATLAMAAPSRAADTVTTFVVLPGSLSISAPALTVDLGSTAPGGTLTTQLGAVAVTDTRGDGGTWTATVSSSSFTSGLNTIANTALKYWSGAETASTGTGGLLTPGHLTSSDAQVLSASRTAFGRSGDGTGANSATWNPTVVIKVPATATAGLYAGTITHSVA
jgi:hypothetical protein